MAAVGIEGVGGMAVVIGANRSRLLRPLDDRRNSPDRTDWHLGGCLPLS